MGMRIRQTATDSPKAEVGEIDTRAPFASVKAALSLFGAGASSPEKLTVRRPKPAPIEVSPENKITVYPTIVVHKISFFF